MLSSTAFRLCTVTHSKIHHLGWLRGNGEFKSWSSIRPTIFIRLSHVIKGRPLLSASFFGSGQCVLVCHVLCTLHFILHCLICFTEYNVGFCYFHFQADYIIQKRVERNSEFNWKRSATFGMFGMGYMGLVYHAIYCKLYPRMFRGIRTSMRVPLQMTLDATIHCGLLV